MTLYIDPECSTCHGSGKVMGGDEYHGCPGCRLRARYARRWCDSCHAEKPVAGMREMPGEFGNVYTICAACIEAATLAHESSVEAQWRDLRDSGADELTLRAMAGDR